MKITRKSVRSVLRIVLYLRKSTKKKSQEPSVDQQRRAGQAWVKRLGGKVVGEYVDAGISGVSSADGRPGFSQMRSDASGGTFDVVWAWDVARLSRSDAVETLNEIGPFYRHGVKLAYADRLQPLDLKDLKDLIEMVFQSQSSSETSRAMSKGVGRGFHDIARKGNWVTGCPPLGFAVCKETRRLVISSKRDAEMVRWVFSAYEQGESLRGIVREMKARGFKSNPMTVRRMLGNILYTGDWLWPRTCQAKLYRQELVDGTALPISVEGTNIHHPSPLWRRSYTVEPENQYYLKDNHPEIIARSQYDNVQRIMADGRRQRCTTPNPEARKALGFANQLLRCSKCGSTMTGATQTLGNGTRAVFYTCNGGRRDVCQAQRVRQGPLMDLVMDRLEELYDNPETAKRLADAARTRLKKDRGGKGKLADLEAAKTELTRLHGKYDRAATQSLEVKYAEAIAQCEDRIARLTEESAAASQGLPEILADIEKRAQRASLIMGKLRSVRNSPEAWRAIVQTIVSEVRVLSEKKGGRWVILGGEIVLHSASDNLGNYLSQYGTKLGQVKTRDLPGETAIWVPLKTG